MAKVPDYVRNLLEERKNRLQRLQDEDPYFPESIASNSRVLIIEGISGSGKDTFQAYLKEKLAGRNVYDFSEGEMLYSWKHSEIEGICELRIKFMKVFVNHVRDIVNQDKTAVFLLNRFHLSAYVWTVARQPELEREYDEIVNVLRTLPVHVFILQVDTNEIEKRILHPERSGSWYRKYRQQMITKEGFRDRSERYLWQQRILLEVAKRQQLPYSVTKFPAMPSSWKRIAAEKNLLPKLGPSS